MLASLGEEAKGAFESFPNLEWSMGVILGKFSSSGILKRSLIEQKLQLENV